MGFCLTVQVLCKYRSGKLPKAFKIIPALSNWEQILYLTEPETWSAAAMYQATRCDTNTHMRTQCHVYDYSCYIYLFVIPEHMYAGFFHQT